MGGGRSGREEYRGLTETEHIRGREGNAEKEAIWRAKGGRERDREKDKEGTYEYSIAGKK